METGDYVIFNGAVVEVVKSNGTGGTVEVVDIGDPERLSPEKRLKLGKVTSVLEELDAS